MTRSEVEGIVTKVLEAVVEAVGVPAPIPTPGACPVGTLPNFDSVLAEDTTVEIFERLGLDEDLDVNPFFKGTRPATFAEVVDTLHALVAGGE